VYFPFATVEHITAQFHLGCSLLRYWTSRTTSLELTHKFGKQTAHNWQTSIDTTQTNDWFFIFGISFLLSYSSSQHNLRSDPVCKTRQLLQFLNECYTCILISHLQHSTTQTPISQTLSSHWQRGHYRRPDLSHITDTNVLITWLNRTQIIPAKLTRSGKFHLDVSSSGQVPSALIHLKTTEDWGATDYKQSSVGSTNQSNTPKEFTSIQNGLNSFNSSH
jgi:hypothetical protein